MLQVGLVPPVRRHMLRERLFAGLGRRRLVVECPVIAVEPACPRTGGNEREQQRQRRKKKNASGQEEHPRRVGSEPVIEQETASPAAASTIGTNALVGYWRKRCEMAAKPSLSRICVKYLH